MKSPIIITRRRLLTGAAALSAYNSLPARAQFTGGNSFGTPGFTSIAAAGGAPYSGPGDITTYSNWWGLRGYSAAHSTGSNPAADLVDQAGANTLTVNILSNGTLDVASISAWVTAHSVTTIKVTKLYDQVGASPMIQATLASMPVLVLGPVSGLASNRPAMLFAGAQSILSLTLGPFAQPLSYSAVAINNSSGTNGGIIADPVPNDAEMIFGNSANLILIYAGSGGVSITATDNVWHAISGAFNGASSIINADGTTSSAANAGTNGVSAAVQLGLDSFGDFLTGKINEAGIATSGLSGTVMSSVSSNAHSYWGF